MNMASGNDTNATEGNMDFSNLLNMNLPQDLERLTESMKFDSSTHFERFMRAMKSFLESDESEQSSSDENEGSIQLDADDSKTSPTHTRRFQVAIEEIRKKKLNILHIRSDLMKEYENIVEMQDNLITDLLGNVKQDENDRGMSFIEHRRGINKQDQNENKMRTTFDDRHAKKKPSNLYKDENCKTTKHSKAASEDNTSGKEKKGKSQKKKLMGDQEKEIKEIIYEKTTNKEYEMPEQYENNEHVQYWRRHVKTLVMQANESGSRHVPGTVSLICLDTSASMNEGNAWQQAMQFLNDYFEGVETLSDQDASHDVFILITFGLEVKVAVGLTKDIGAIRQHIENVSPQGPTPMFAGLALSQAMVSSLDVPFALYNHLLVRPQIILITDGQPSEVDRLTGEDTHDLDRDKIQQTKDILLEEAARIKRSHCDLHCVLVGKEDPSFLQMLQERSNVKGLKKHKDGRSMATYTFFRVMNEGDQQFVRTQNINVNRNREPKTISVINGSIINWYKESSNKNYLSIGTRVRLVADWKSPDKKGVGTVIGHNEDQSDRDQLWVNVEWDNDGSKLAYRIDSGPNTSSDIEVVDEDRIPPPGKILAVGSKVIPGPDFKGDINKKGVVIKLIGYSRADVRWNDNTRGQYSYGQWGNVEIRPLMKPVPKPEKVVLLNDEDLTLIARAIGQNWEFFAIQIGLSQTEVQRIKTENDNVVKQMFEVLQKWKANKRAAATWPNLRSNLEKCKETYIDWEMLEERFGPWITEKEKHVQVLDAQEHVQQDHSGDPQKKDQHSC